MTNTSYKTIFIFAAVILGIIFLLPIVNIAITVLAKVIAAAVVISILVYIVSKKK